MQVKNISDGPRGVHAVGGPVMLEAGQSVVLELSAAEMKSSKRTGWFEFSGDADDLGDEPDPEAMKAAAAALLAKEKAGGLHFKTFEAEAKEILGDETPNDKAGIIAALEKAAA